jgi:magnesium transporter
MEVSVRRVMVHGITTPVENAPMIRGMGLYGADSEAAIDDVRSWEAPGDSPVEPKLLALKEQCETSPGSFVWLGLFEPTKAELALVADVFSLEHLQVEDAANDAQRPKVEVGAGGRVFVIAKVLDYLERSSDVQTGQLSVFIGPWFAVTVRFGQIGNLRGIRRRLETTPELRAHGPISVLYSVLDLIVDGYLTVTDEIAQDIEDVETEVFSGIPASNNANRIYRLKRENVEIRRAVSPLVPFAHTWVNESMTWIPIDMRPYFRDIGEHLLRASDATESSDNLLMTMLMVSTSLQDLQQNRDMRKISAWVAIAAVPTMIAGIYGMNFDYMPELHQPWGYPAVLLLMGTACFSLYRGFKRSGWL